MPVMVLLCVRSSTRNGIRVGGSGSLPEDLSGPKYLHPTKVVILLFLHTLCSGFRMTIASRFH